MTPAASDTAESRPALRRLLGIPALAAGVALVLVTAAACIEIATRGPYPAFAYFWPFLVAPCVLSLGLSGLGAAAGPWLRRTAVALGVAAWAVMLLEVILVILVTVIELLSF